MRHIQKTIKTPFNQNHAHIFSSREKRESPSPLKYNPPSPTQPAYYAQSPWSDAACPHSYTR